MTLPPEILDKVLGYIPTDNEGRQTLVACALVATWWMELSQGRLLSLVSINNDNHQRWIDSVISSPSKAHLLQYVRSLLHRRGAFGFGYRMQNLPLHSGEYLSALRNLRSLTLSKIRIEHIGEEEFHTCFSAFRETLTFLSLENFVASFSAFITLVDYFPISELFNSASSGRNPTTDRSHLCLGHFGGKYTSVPTTPTPSSGSIGLLGWTWSTRSW